MESLTTLASVKAWLASDQGVAAATPALDEILERLITAVSGLVLDFLNRDTLARTTRTETYPGGRTGVLLLRNWPVLSVSSLGIGISSMTSDGYTLEGVRAGGGCQRIYLSEGRTFLAPGPAGVAVTYISGFVRSETLLVPASGSPVVQTSACWLGDVGVAELDGTLVTGYTVSEGSYTLPPALTGQSVVVTYSFVPPQIEQAVIDEVVLAFRSRQRIGEYSKALPNGGGTVQYLPRRLSDITKEALNSSRLVVPQ